MMESAHEVLLTKSMPPSHQVSSDGHQTDHSEPTMTFHCRPDLSGRQVLFQGRHTGASNSPPEQSAPVQLVTMDGRSHLGLTLAGRESPSNATRPSELGRDDDKLPKVQKEIGSPSGIFTFDSPLFILQILVSTSPLTDSASLLRIRQLQVSADSEHYHTRFHSFVCPSSHSQQQRW